MKKWIKKSFHRQLLVCFGVVALLPLLLFGVFLIQTMETKINSDYEKKVTEQAEQIDAGILELFQEFEMVVENINANTRIVEQIGEDDTWSKSKMPYRTLQRSSRAQSIWKMLNYFWNLPSVVMYRDWWRKSFSGELSAMIWKSMQHRSRQN